MNGEIQVVDEGIMDKCELSAWRQDGVDDVITYLLMECQFYMEIFSVLCDVIFPSLEIS